MAYIEELISTVKRDTTAFQAESTEAFTVLLGIYSKLKYRPHLFKDDNEWIQSFLSYLDNNVQNERTRTIVDTTYQLFKVM